jgi:DedD protein
MSEERKKLIWISVSACVFGLVLIGTGFFLFAPRSGGAAAPATIGNISAPKALYPQDYFSAPLPAPIEEEQPTTMIGPDGSTYVIYGEPLSPSLSPADSVPALPESMPNSATTKAPAASGAAAATSPKTPAEKPSSPDGSAKTRPTSSAGKITQVKAIPKKVKADYWIQAASFTSRGRADDLKNMLAEKGIATHITVKDIVGKSWYRVRVGPYISKAEAEGWLERLKVLPQCAEAYIMKGN